MWLSLQPRAQVPDLVASRKVVVAKGDAYVAGEQLGSLVAARFRDSLAHALIMTAGRWATSTAAQEESRLAPVVRSLATRYAPCVWADPVTAQL